jgi:hypothetical protein
MTTPSKPEGSNSQQVGALGRAFLGTFSRYVAKSVVFAGLSALDSHAI